MAAVAGKDVLVKINDGNGTYITLGGLRTRQLSFSADAVDITDQDSPGRWRELLSGAGTRHASISGSGLFRNGASDQSLRLGFFAGNIVGLSFIIPGYGTITGQFCLTALNYKSDYSGAAFFDMTAESAGVITFTAA